MDAIKSASADMVARQRELKPFFASRHKARIAGMDFVTFQFLDKTNSAVMRKLEIIGEAAKQVPEAIGCGR